MDALVGFEKSFKHLDGHEVKVSSKVEDSLVLRVENTVAFSKLPINFFPAFVVWCFQEVTKPGEVRRLKGEGMPIYEKTKKGDLVITFTVAFPKSLTEGQKNLIRANFS